MPPAALRASCHIYGRGYSLPDARAELLARYGVARLAVRDAVWPDFACPPTRAEQKERPDAWACSEVKNHFTDTLKFHSS